MISLLSVIAAVLLILTPINVLMNRIYQHSRGIHARLDKPKTRTYFSNSALIYAMNKLLEIAKGYLVPFLIDLAFFSDGLTTLAIVAMLALNNWSPFLNFKNRYHGLFLLWGVYTFLAPSLFWVFPLLGLGSSFLFNSVYTGILVTILGYMLVFMGTSTDPSLLATNFAIFVLAFLAIVVPLFSHLEKHDGTLLAIFNKRH